MAPSAAPWLTKPTGEAAAPKAMAKRGPKKRLKTGAAPDQHTLPELIKGLGGYQAKMPSFSV